MRDVSDWLFLGYGERSTLEKEELRSPSGKTYIMKYPRPFDGKRTNWEDVNEVIAAKIAKLLGFPYVKAEIAYRKKRRGCLMVHFVEDLGADLKEAGAVLLEAEFEDRYHFFQNKKLTSDDLIVGSFEMIQDFSYFNHIKNEFIAMNIFDILIGNQDRHPYNWQILFRQQDVFFSPFYDNGASLGWQLSDSKLLELINDPIRMNRFYNRLRVKAGLFENTTPPLSGKKVLKYLLKVFPEETHEIIYKMKEFNWSKYEGFINDLPLISSTRKEFMRAFLRFRMNKILSYI